MVNNTSTTNSSNPQTCSLKAISEAMKKVAALPDTREEDKILGIKAAAIKFMQPENHRNMSDEDKVLIDQAIETAAYINRLESNQQRLKI